MRTLLLIATMFFFTTVNSQSFSPLGYPALGPGIGFSHNISKNDSTGKQKWFLSTNKSLYSGISFSRGSNAAIVAAPMSVQLNRRLNNNLYAFANVGITPAYVSLNSSSINGGFGKPFSANPFNSSSLGINPSVSLGLMYINDARTFSISGSISAERSSYPLVPFYNPGQPTVMPVRK